MVTPPLSAAGMLSANQRGRSRHDPWLIPKAQTRHSFISQFAVQNPL